MLILEANTILKRNNLCADVGSLLVTSAQDISAVSTNRSEELTFMKALWDVAFKILVNRPSPNRMITILYYLHVPIGWELYVRKEEALCMIETAKKDVERWLTSELSGERYGMRSVYSDWDWMGFEDLELSGEPESTKSFDSQLDSEFKDFSEEGVMISDEDVEEMTPDRAQTM